MGLTIATYVQDHIISIRVITHISTFERSTQVDRVMICGSANLTSVVVNMKYFIIFITF